MLWVMMGLGRWGQHQEAPQHPSPTPHREVSCRGRAEGVTSPQSGCLCPTRSPIPSRKLAEAPSCLPPALLAWGGVGVGCGVPALWVKGEGRGHATP